MACNSKENSIQYLVSKGATNDVRKILDRDLFDNLNDSLTEYAERKYGLDTMGAKLFSISTGQVPYLQGVPAFRESAYDIKRAVPNDVLFERLDELVREYENRSDSDQPMYMRTEAISEEKSDQQKFIEEAEELGLPIFEFDASTIVNARSKEVATILANRLALGLKVNYYNITEQEARDILKNSPIPYQGEPAFFFAGTVYTVGDNVNMNTVLHEFSHPLLQGIKQTNKPLFDSLYLQLSSTTEGKQIIDHVKQNYPELSENTDRFKEEALAYGLQLKAFNKVNNQIETEGFDSFVKNLLYQIGQFLKKVFGNKVNVAKLSADTTLEELADMLLEKDFVYQTDKVTYDDFVAFMRATNDRADFLMQNISSKAIIDAINNVYASNMTILERAKNFKGDTKTRERVKRSLLEKDGNQLTPGVRKSLVGYQTITKKNQSIDEIIDGALDAEKLRQQNLRNQSIGFVTSLEITNNSVKLIEKELKELQKKKNLNRADIALLGLYKGTLVRWAQSMSDLYDILKSDFEITTDNEFSQLLNEISANISESQKIINDVYRENGINFFVEITGYMSDFVKSELKTDLGTVLKGALTEEQFEKFYNDIVEQKLSDKDVLDLVNKYGVPEQYVNRLIDRYNYFVINETKIRDIFEGKFKDVSIVNRFLESYSSSTSPIVGSLSVYLDNQKTEAERRAWENSLRFRNKLDKLLPQVAEFSKWNTRLMLDLVAEKDYIAFFDKKEGKMIKREVYTFLNEFGNGWRYDQDMLEYAVDEARQSGDMQALRDAEIALEQFRRDYMHDEFVPEYYEKNKMFDESPMGKQAWVERKLALDEYAAEANKLQNEAERFENYSTVQEAWRKYQLLFSLVNEDGTPKTGEALEKAQILLKHREQTRDFSEFFPIPGSLQTAYNEFVTLKRAEGRTEDEIKDLVAEWQKQNTIIKYKPEFYESRTKLLNKLQELQDKMPPQDVSVSDLYKKISNLIYGFKDEHGQPDPNALGDDRLKQINDYQQEINDFNFAFDNRTGLTRAEMAELKVITNAQRTRSLTEAEEKRYLFLVQKQTDQGLSVEETIEYNSILEELGSLTQKVPTEYYLDQLNYNLSRFGIGPVEENNINNYINTPEFFEIVKADENFYNWFLLNHVTKKVYEKGVGYENKFERTLANSVTIPKDTSLIETTAVVDQNTGEEIILTGVPNSRHSIYTVKDKYRTIPFGLTAEERKKYIGKVIDNKGNFLPRKFDGTRSGAKTDKYMSKKYADIKRQKGPKSDLLDAITEYHLGNQEGKANMAKLYMDVPRYAINSVVEAFQSGQYGERYQQLKTNFSEFWAQAFGKSKVDFENGFNYNAENNLVNTDLNGEEITYIPVTGLYNLEADKVSPDIFEGLMRYSMSLETHDVLLENLPLIQSLVDSLSEPDAQPKNLEKFRKDLYKSSGVLKNVIKKGGTNNMLGQIKSLVERELYGIHNSDTSEKYPRLTKALNTMQKLSATSSLAINIPSDLKNKYGAMVQLIIESAGAEYISLKDMAAGRMFAYKAMMSWSSNKGVYAVGPGDLSVQLIEAFNPVFRTEDQFGKSVTRSLLKDLANGEWMYMHRKFGEMEVGVTLFGSFLNGQKVDQTINGKTQSIKYADAWELDKDTKILKLKEGIHPKWNFKHVDHTIVKGDTLDSIAKQYGVTVEELKARNKISSNIELIEGDVISIAKSEGFNLFKNQLQGTSRLLFGTYDKFGQPEANKWALYRLYMFMRKWFTSMFTNRFGSEVVFTEGKMLPEFRARYDWALGKTRKGYYITAMQFFVDMLKSKGQNVKYMKEEEKVALRKLAAESLFVIGFALMASLLFGYDDDDEDKWQKIKGRSGAYGTDTFRTYGFLQNQMLLLMMGTQAETSAFVPLPKVGGVNFGLDDYSKMLTSTSTAFGNTVLLYAQILQDFLNMATFNGAARYQRDAGPYGWEEKGDLKLIDHLLKTIGFTGSSGDPETVIKNLRASGERVR
jgi:LysM repeat protein